MCFINSSEVECYDATYYDRTCYHLNITVGEHSDLSLLTKKKCKIQNNYCFRLLLWEYVLSPEDFKIFANSNAEVFVKI